MPPLSPIFQFETNPKKRTTSLSLNIEEREELNEILQSFQDETGQAPDTMKDAILCVFREMRAKLSGVSIDFQPEIREPELPENAVILGEMDTVIRWDSETDALATQLLTEADQPLDTPKDVIVKNAMEMALREPEVIEKEIPVEVQVERPTSANEVVLNLSNDQLMVMEQIQKNRWSRAASLKLSEMETLSKLVENSFFNKGNLYNWHGNFFTGL